jgi:dolichol-phosphate mannosyltransferase
MKPSISVLIPVRNEQKNIADVLDELIEILTHIPSKFEILVNEDASTDLTGVILDTYQKKNAHIRIFHQSKPLGIAEGLEYLYKKSRYPYIFIQSGDGQYSAQDLPEMLGSAVRGCDVVIGRRIEKRYSIGRKVVSLVFNGVTYLLFGVQTYDAGSIKVYRRRVITQCIPISRGVYNEAERIIRAKMAGFTICAVPVHHLVRSGGVSTGARWSLILEACVDMLRLWYLLRIKPVFLFFSAWK